VVLLLQINVLGEMSAGKQDHVQDSHRLLVIEDDMINFVNEKQKQQVTYVSWLLSLVAIYEKMFCTVVM
jgi:hypothetical protein